MSREHIRRPLTLVGRILVVLTLAAAMLGVPLDVAAADAPGRCSSAVPAAQNTWTYETISTGTDVDWFRFATTTGSRTLITLGRLAADYDLYLYSGCSTLLASSHRSGTSYDEIYRYLPAGTYRVKVVGFAGAHSPTAYALRFRPIAWGMPVLSSTTWTDAAGYLHVVGEVLNNTSDNRRWIEIDATFRNTSGVALASAVGYSDVATLRPGSRSPFEIVARRPAGYASTSLKVCTPSSTGGCLAGQVTGAPGTALSVSPGASPIDAAGRRHYTGTIRNMGTTAARLTRSLVTQYDAYGNVRGVGVGPASPSSLAAGASGSFDVIGSSNAGPNRVGYVAEASTTGCTTSPRYTTSGRENFVPPIARPSASGRVALTFDMGGRMTPAVRILNLLVSNHVCATIFPTGAISQTAEGQAALAVVKAHPDLFEIGNHTMHHCDLVRGGGGAPGAADAAYCKTLASRPTRAQVQKELLDAEAAIKQYTGISPKPFWRAPYGSYDSTVGTYAAEVGYTKHFDWDVDTIDWKPISDGGPTARAITVKVVNNAKSGSVVLMHLGGYETLDALQAMIDGLRGRGYVLTTLSDMAQ